MKHIIICGIDRCGKNSLIKGICDHYNYNGVHIRHFDKPPKTLTSVQAFEFQKNTFSKEGNFIECISNLEKDQYYYHENVLIWNRSPYGEYVYGQMFRKLEKKVIIKYIRTYDNFYLYHDNTYFIMLTADPEFCLKQEDGNSFSKTIEQKTKEISLFNEVFELSSLNKLKIKVNDGDNYISKETILNNTLNFINNGKH